MILTSPAGVHIGTKMSRAANNMIYYDKNIVTY